ncbi:hypothetical protein I3842_05G210900 [Carya illinoinensis]|uniref:Secreted protein n=1 Tax=Carya illinoinensis TaxID=32201 RepID=A0A922F5T7_CARIL|nr:hypothetical protein I3842_05G210900 [Carya illinoinensis]
MVKRNVTGHLLLLLAMKCVRSKWASSPKFSMKPGAKELNHALADPRKVNGKVWQATPPPGKPCNVICTLKILKCLTESRVPLYISMGGSETLLVAVPPSLSCCMQTRANKDLVHR